MNRTKVVVGCTLAVLAAAAAGQLMLDAPAKPSPAPQPQTQAQTQTQPAVSQADSAPPSAADVVDTFLPSIKDGDEESRLLALGGLVDVLSGTDYAKSVLPADAGAALADAVAPLIHPSSGEAQESWQVKLRAAALVVGRTKAPAARELALSALAAGPDDLRDAVVAQVGRPGGVGGPRVFAALQQASAKLPVSAYAAALRRVGGRKAIVPLTALLRGSSDDAAVTACAVALQDYRDPSLMSPVLERLEQLGMLDDSTRLPWLSAKLLEGDASGAEGAELLRAVKALRARPSLTGRSQAILARAFDKGDEQTKRVAADAVKRAVVAKMLDDKSAEKLLASYQPQKPEPVLKAELPGVQPTSGR